MDENKAKELARDFLAENIELTVHSEIPFDIYIPDIDPEDIIVMRFSLFDEPKVGSSKFVMVSKIDGSIRYVGNGGE